MAVLIQTHVLPHTNVKNTDQQKLYFRLQQKLQNLKYKALKHEINCHKKKLRYSLSRVAIICVEKLHWQVVSINTAISGGKKNPYVSRNLMISSIRSTKTASD